MTPTIQQIAELAHSTVAGFPEQFRALAREVVIQIADWPDPDFLADLGIDDPLDLTGMYDGIPMTEKSVMDPGFGPDVVWLFREPILAELRERAPEGIDLETLVAHVTVHEFAHHFGWSDADIATIDRWWE